MAHFEVDKVIFERSQSEESSPREPARPMSAHDVMDEVMQLMSAVDGVVQANPAAIIPLHVAKRLVLRDRSHTKWIQNENIKECKREIDGTQAGGPH